MDDDFTTPNTLRRRADALLQQHLISQDDAISSLREDFRVMRMENAQAINELKKEHQLMHETIRPIMEWTTSRMESKQKWKTIRDKSVLAFVGAIVTAAAVYFIDLFKRYFQMK